MCMDAFTHILYIITRFRRFIHRVLQAIHVLFHLFKRSIAQYNQYTMFHIAPTILIKAILFLSALTTTSNAIRCYQCGSEAIFVYYNEAQASKSKLEKMEDTALTLESCANLEYSFSSWGMYSVDCGLSQICMKTIIDDGFDDRGKHHYFTSSRGCAMRNTSFGKVHPLGCGILNSNVIPPTDTNQNKRDLVCFCDTDYCNASNSIGVACSVLGFNFVIFAVYTFLSSKL